MPSRVVAFPRPARSTRGATVPSQARSACSCTAPWRSRPASCQLLLIPVSFAITGGVWLGLSLLLPHADATWRALLPGAALFAIGHAALEVATVYYFAPKLTRAPALYGSLGTAATLLLWLFLISRIIVASGFLNAALWRRSGGA